MNTYHIRLEARLVFAVKKLPPVDTVEEWVSLDFGCAIHTQTLHWISVEQASQKIACSRWHNFWAREMERFGQDLTIHVVGVLVVKRRQPRKHLVKKYTECPPVDSLCVAGAVKKFWSEILWRSTECVGLVLILHIELAQSEIAQRNVTSVVEQNVLGLEIAVDDVESVKTF